MQCVLANDLNALVASTAGVLSAERFESPLTEDWLIVPNQDTGRWLLQQLTDILGGVINTRVLTLDEALLALVDGPSQTTLKQHLYWPIASTLKDVYPTTDDTLTEHTLRMTSLFAHYIIDRPDWLMQWEQGQTPPTQSLEWQGVLWRRLQHESPLSLHHQLIEASNGDASLAIDTVSRVVLFAPDRISQVALSVLQQLAKLRPCIALIQTPSEANWFIESHDLHDRGSTLLADLGRERAALLTLVEPLQPGTGLTQPASNSVLTAIQSAIFKDEPLSTQTPDASLRLVAAATPHQEVMALKHWIIEYLNADPSHDLRDIQVVTPDPGRYGPVVQQVFQSAVSTSSIPMAPDPLISGRLIDTCMRYLKDTLSTGFHATRLMQALVEEPVRGVFQLTDRDLRHIEQWLSASGARRGLRGHRHTLEAAKRRLVRGLMADPVHALTSDATPTEAFETRHAVDAVLAWLTATERLLDQPKQMTPSEAWKQLEGMLRMLSKDTIQSLGDSPHRLERLPVLPLETLFGWFELTQNAGLSRPVALGDTLSVTSPQTIRAINTPVVAILGANDGTFPSEVATDAWDLMALYPRTGDRIHEQSERQAFLDIVVNTTQKLWISWIGFHPVTLKPELPSASVMSLLQSLDPDPEAQKRWITAEPIGLSLPPTPEDQRSSHSNRVQQHGYTDLEMAEVLQIVTDPAAAFLRAKGARIIRSDADRLALEPVELDGLQIYQLRERVAEGADQAALTERLIHDPESPIDLDLNQTLSGLFPDAVQQAVGQQHRGLTTTLQVSNDCSLHLIDHLTPDSPRITNDSGFTNQRTLAALFDCVCVFAATGYQEPMQIVSFDGKTRPVGPIDAPVAQALIGQWIPWLIHAFDQPIPLITPLAIEHVKKLSRDPSVTPTLDWSARALQYRPQFRRLFADTADFAEQHRRCCEQLVLPMYAYIGKANATV